MKKVFFLLSFSIITLILSAQTLSTVQQELSTPWVGFGYNQWGYARQSDGVTYKAWDNELWNTTEQRILAINPGLVRLPLVREWFNSDDNGNVLPIGTYNWNSKYMQSYFKTMDLYKANNINVMSGLWGAGDNETESFWTSTDFANLQADLIDYLINVKGYKNIKYYTPINEPRGYYPSYSVWSMVITNLHNILIQRGLPSNILIGADSWDTWVWLPAKENKAQLIAYDFHNYLNDTPDDTYNALYSRSLEEMLRNQVNLIADQDNTNKPVLLSEMAPIGVPFIDWPVADAPAHCRVETYEYGLGWWDYGVQILRSGIATGLAWGLDGFGQNKNAGMWNNAGTYGGMTLRPWYYTWQLMCRYFPADAKVLKMSEMDGKKDLRIAGARIGVNDYSFVVVNRRNSAESKLQTVTFKATGQNKTFYVYTYSRQYYGNGIELSLPYIVKTTNSLENDGITIDVPLESGVLITTLPPFVGDPTPSVSSCNIDFESDSACNLVVNKDDGIVAVKSSNPRNQTANPSSNACQVTQSMPVVIAKDPGKCYVSIQPVAPILVTSEKAFLTFQTYRNSYSCNATFGIKLRQSGKMYASGFAEIRRNWETRTLDLSAFIGQEIEQFVYFPNSDFFSLNPFTDEISSIDNIQTVSTGTNSLVPTEINPNSDFTPITMSCNFDFEQLQNNIYPSLLAKDPNSSVEQTSNPQMSGTNVSNNVLKVTQTPPSTNDFGIGLNPTPYIYVTERTYILHFQSYRPISASSIAVQLKISGRSVPVKSDLLVSQRRTWTDFQVDLSSYIGKIIEDIQFLPNTNFTNRNSGYAEDTYFDNIALNNQISTGIQTSNDENFSNVIYVTDNTLHIGRAEGEFLSIYSMDGKVVMLKKQLQENETFELNKGCYLVQIGSTVRKVVI